MDCPGSEYVAACVEGRLDPAEESLFLEHCADCEDCRHELALARGASASSPGPLPRLGAQVRRAVLRAAERERGGSRPRRLLAARLARPRPRYGYAAAAAILVALAGAAAFIGSRIRPEPVRPEVAERPEPAGSIPESPPAEEAPAPPRRDVPSPLPEEPVPVDERPRVPEPEPPAPPREPAPPPAPAGEPAPEVRPEPGETRSEEPPAGTKHVLVARALSPILITDAGGTLSVRRKGARGKEPVGGAARLDEGDVLSAEKPSGFRIGGDHPVVLGGGAEVSLAYAAQEQAPWLHLHAGEVIVNSTEPSPWIVSDGKVSVAVHRVVGRFAVFASGERLAMAAVSEPIHARPDGGRACRVAAGHELVVGPSGAEIRRSDPGDVRRKTALFDSGRPRQRTVFYTSCDPEDARRGHVFVSEGVFFRNEALLTREGPGRTFSAALSPSPRFGWREGLVLRFRYMTNATSLQAALRVEERRYTLFRAIGVERKGVNRWHTAEIPLALAGMGFRRDDGGPTLFVGPRDMIDSIRFTVQQKDVFGDQKAYVVVDDVEVFEKE